MIDPLEQRLRESLAQVRVEPTEHSRAAAQHAVERRRHRFVAASMSVAALLLVVAGLSRLVGTTDHQTALTTGGDGTVAAAPGPAGTGSQRSQVSSVNQDCKVVPNDCTPTEQRLAAVPTTAPQPQGAVTVSRDDALRRAANNCAELQSISRVRAKLSTWSELQAAGAFGDATPHVSNDTRVWIVAVSGAIRPAFGRGRTFESAAEFIDASSGAVLSFGAYVGKWPGYFDMVVDRSGDGSPDAGDQYVRPGC